MKQIHFLAAFLGGSIFVFGILKFIDPFRSWYQTQISSSGLGTAAYWLGIIGEIGVGAMLLLTVINRKKFSSEKIRFMGVTSASLLVLMMATGMYVHLHPAVPAAVLPLKIKPPYIPAFFLLAALIHIRLLMRQIK
ncbi:hypothetical protein L0U88_10650 [Flavihumibacter sp. RY-1]|uniref:DoxX-like protein n=1 Tax=Flavihumibacter fluminis TaxID=2909236 RepID=A0ABS9BIR4_9BACT|nr:hypothetical protein [Flavihumibacter fluminis]MCF1715084.1 hypothetical protein [Flavihumibacter fluminis]